MAQPQAIQQDEIEMDEMNDNNNEEVFSEGLSDTEDDIPPKLDDYNSKVNHNIDHKKSLKFYSIGFYIIIAGITFFASALFSLGIYIIEDHVVFSEVLISSTYSVGIYMATFTCAIVIINVFVGLIGIRHKNKLFLWTFTVVLIIMFIVNLCSVVFIGIFPFTNPDNLRESLKSSIQKEYYNSRLITDAWDYAQTKLRCCSVDDRDWHVYRDSFWYSNVNSAPGMTIIPENNPLAQLVPKSCCVMLFDPLTRWPNETNPRDIARCQNWGYGPPLHHDGAHNDALYYRGCFETMKEYLTYHIRFVLPLGILLLLFIICGTIASCCLLTKINRHYKEN